MLPHRGDVRLEVFDTSGRRVRTLVNESMIPGPHVVTWDRTVDGDRTAATSVYFLRLTFEETTVSRKLTLID